MTVELDDLPIRESIHTVKDERSERRRNTRSRIRRSDCAKKPYTRKQCLTVASTLMSKGRSRLWTYKCECGFYHLTSSAPRNHGKK